MQIGILITYKDCHHAKKITKYIGPKICHHSNMCPSLDSAIAYWSRNAITTVLGQAAALDFQSGPDFSEEKFLGHCILNGKS